MLHRNLCKYLMEFSLKKRDIFEYCFFKMLFIVVHHPARELFSEKTLRITDYESQRLKIKNFKFSQRRLLFELQSNNTPKLIDSTKQWIHMMDKRDCETDFLLLQQCLRQIRESADPSSTFNFGPTTMRMMHYFNLPDQAIRVIQVKF